MNVETILRTKGRDVATIGPDATIGDAVAILKTRRIGAIVVSRDGRSVEGILSERDIVHALADQAAALLGQKVSKLMTRNVMTCAPGDTVEEIMGQMTNGRFRHLPVMNDGRLCGIVSIGDLVKNRLEEVEHEASSLREFITTA
jgi:CBS domain-containing protein